eukprot:12415548-Karenia_brevis.AAC.1
MTWRRRCENKEADALANAAVDQQAALVYVSPKLSKRASLKDVAIQSWSDGAHRRQGVSAAGAVIKAWHEHWMQPKVLTAVA